MGARRTIGKTRGATGRPSAARRKCRDTAAAARAAELKRDGLRFIETDAVDWVRPDSVGTVFFLYCPFSGERLQRVLDALEGIAQTRRIRVCSVDLAPFERSWLEPLPTTSADLHVYQSSEIAT